MTNTDHKLYACMLAGLMIDHIMQDQEHIGLVDITEEDALRILKEIVAITEHRLNQALTV